MGNYPYRHNFDSIDGICEMNATDSQGITPPHRRNMGLGVSYGQTTTPLQEALENIMYPPAEEDMNLIVPGAYEIVMEARSKVIDQVLTLFAQELQAFAEQLPDKIKEITVSGVAVPRQELDKISLQDLRLVLAEILRGVQNG